mgnify:CR=1 FL=1|tara:strand:+ start:429 stop:1253 length:825 start_codon:yes stop_codon:yes gene_type:complete
MLEYSKAFHVTTEERASFLEFAVAISRKAGAAALSFFRSRTGMTNKLSDGSYDPVTEADLAVERILREAIELHYPLHGICGEEYGFRRGNGLTWVIDPIDGTRAFISGLLHWGILLSLFDGQRPILGVMYQPYTDELFFGEGNNSTLQYSGNSQKLCTSAQTNIEDAVVGTTSHRFFGETNFLNGFQRLEESARFTSYSGDCYLYAMLASGQIDIAVDTGLQPYDIQALIPIVEGAGGSVTSENGGNASLGGTVVATANTALHRKVLRIFSESS